MKPIYRRSTSYGIQGYSTNAALQLIVASCTGFISYHLVRTVLMVADAQPTFFGENFTANLGLPPVSMLGNKFWTILTYGWIHNGFWDAFSNMIWLYCFGSIVQMLVSYKQVIPIFIYSLVAGGICYLLGQLLPGVVQGAYLFGAQAGVMGLAVAALTLSPSYRMYFTPTFSIPLVVVACIFFVLMVMYSDLHIPNLMLLAGGAAVGFGYIKLVQNGNKPGAWMYDIFDRIGSIAEPGVNAARNRPQGKRTQVLNSRYEPKRGVSQKKLDDILDKINQQGYNSLTQEEKEALLKASKEEHN